MAIKSTKNKKDTRKQNINIDYALLLLLDDTGTRYLRNRLLECDQIILFYKRVS